MNILAYIVCPGHATDQRQFLIRGFLPSRFSCLRLENTKKTKTVLTILNILGILGFLSFGLFVMAMMVMATDVGVPRGFAGFLFSLGFNSFLTTPLWFIVAIIFGLAKDIKYFKLVLLASLQVLPGFP